MKSTREQCCGQICLKTMLIFDLRNLDDGWIVIKVGRDRTDQCRGAARRCGVWIAAHPGGHHPKSFCNWDGASNFIFMSFSKRLWRRGLQPGEQGGAPAWLDVVKKDTNDCKHSGPPIVVKGQLRELLEDLF